MREILWGFLFLLSPTANAEYRVFKLIITQAEKKSEKIVLSTLDPEQYPMYHPLDAGEVISYKETWRCFGRTSGFTPYCPNPNEKQAVPVSPTNNQINTPPT